MKTQFLFGSALACILLAAAPARASSHWQIVEVYSDASGLVQYVELEDKFNGDENLSGLTLSSGSNLFTFSTNLSGTGTADHHVLLGTPAFVANWAVPPADYNLGVANFFNIHGDTLSFASGSNTLTFGSGQLPLDGVKSLNRAYNPAHPTSFTFRPNVATNFAGQTGMALDPGKFVYIDLSKIIFGNGHAVDLLSSPQTIGAAFHYNFDITGHVQGHGPIASRLVPHGTPLATAFNSIQPGAGDAFHGRIFMTPFTDTYPLVNEEVSGSAAGIVAITGSIASGVDDGVAEFQFQNVTFSTLGVPDNQDFITFGSDCHLLGYNADIVKSDFNVDGQSDLVLYEPKTRQLKVTFLKNSSFLDHTAALSTFFALGKAELPAGYVPVDVGEFGPPAAGDGYEDLLVSNTSNSVANVFFMKNLALISTTGSALPFIPQGFEIDGVGDFNVDQYTDLLLFNPATQATEIMYLEGTNYLTGDTTSIVDGPTIPAGYVVKGVSDFNDDGVPDLLLFNPTDNTTKCIFLNKGTLGGVTAMGPPVDGPTVPAGYTLVGSGGFEDNRHVDLIIFNPTTHYVKFILLDGKTFTETGTANLGAIPAGLQIVAPR